MGIRLDLIIFFMIIWFDLYVKPRSLIFQFKHKDS